MPAVKLSPLRPAVILHPCWRSNSPFPPQAVMVVKVSQSTLSTQRSSSTPACAYPHHSPPGSHGGQTFPTQRSWRSNSPLSALRSSSIPAGGHPHHSPPSHHGSQTLLSPPRGHDGQTLPSPPSSHPHPSQPVGVVGNGVVGEGRKGDGVVRRVRGLGIPDIFFSSSFFVALGIFSFLCIPYFHWERCIRNTHNWHLTV